MRDDMCLKVGRIGVAVALGVGTTVCLEIGCGAIGRARELDGEDSGALQYQDASVVADGGGTIGIIDGNGLEIETALAAALTEVVPSGRPEQFPDLRVPHTELMISDFGHGCGATTDTGRSLYLELYSSSASERFATPGSYAYWQPNLDKALPSDNRFVAVLSTTEAFGRRDQVADRGEVEVLGTADDRISLKYDLSFFGGATNVSGTVEALLCETWEHSWLGIPRTSPTEPRN